MNTRLQEKAYKAYWEMLDNHEWLHHHLDIAIMKINPETGEIDDDKKKNTQIEYWLETGYFSREHESYCHDISLDCGGYTFEEAIINLSKLVKKHYPKPTNIFGEIAS